GIGFIGFIESWFFIIQPMIATKYKNKYTFLFVSLWLDKINFKYFWLALSFGSTLLDPGYQEALRDVNSIITM
ncbi:MAG TPA: hypothetical protein VM123_03775, partial [archaeon]|nr:hypothetical protein [archaeon]